MTRSELIAELAEANTHLQPRDVELIVSTIFDEICAALARGGGRNRSGTYRLGVSFEEPRDALGFEAAVFCGRGLGWGGAYGGLGHLLGGLHHGLCAPGEAVDLARACACFLTLGIVLIERIVDAAQHGFERYAGLTPRID